MPDRCPDLGIAPQFQIVTLCRVALFLAGQRVDADRMALDRRIAQARQRTKTVLEEALSDNEGKTAELETEEDSGQANDARINGLIKRIRKNGKQYLGAGDGSLTQICKQLRADKSFLKRRELKKNSKHQR